MHQSESKFLYNEKTNTALLYCTCSDTEDHIVLDCDPEDEDWWINVQLAPPKKFWYRVKNTWEFFWKQRTWSNMLINQETAKDLRDWLDVKLKKTEENESFNKS